MTTPAGDSQASVATLPILGGLSRRAKTVWAAFALSMSVVGLGLGALQGGTGGARSDGMTVVPLMAQAGGPASIEAVLRTRSELDTQRWRSIVVHSSGTRHGSPETIEAEHRAMNLRGLGHHFVIGNGRGMDDGEVHVGWRWLDQLPGAHAAGEDAAWYNHHAISICVVGDGERGAFTESQMRRLVELTAFLAQELGIPDDRVVLHSDIASVQSPGRRFPVAAFREQVARLR